MVEFLAGCWFGGVMYHLGMDLLVRKTDARAAGWEPALSMLLALTWPATLLRWHRRLG